MKRQRLVPNPDSTWIIKQLSPQKLDRAPCSIFSHTHLSEDSLYSLNLIHIIMQLRVLSIIVTFSCVISVVSSLSTIPSYSKLPFGINLRCKVNPERRDEFLKLVKTNQQRTLTEEPDALQYLVGQDTTDENCFYIHEQFASSDAFDYHLTTEHNVNWKAFKTSEPSPFENYDVYKYNVIGTSGKTHSDALMNQGTTFGVHVQLCPQPDVLEEFIRVIENNMKGSNSDIEPLCLQYVYGECLDEKNKFIFHEEYAGQNGGKEGFDFHTKTDHFAKWEEFVQKWDDRAFVTPPQVSFFRTI